MREGLKEKLGKEHMTVPQIFINKEYIGGNAELEVSRSCWSTNAHISVSYCALFCNGTGTQANGKLTEALPKRTGP